jgi:hypothetical protein
MTIKWGADWGAAPAIELSKRTILDGFGDVVGATKNPRNPAEVRIIRGLLMNGQSRDRTGDTWIFSP